MAAVEVPQTLEYRGGQLNVAPVLEVEIFTNWKKRYKALMNELVNDGIKLSKLKWVTKEVAKFLPKSQNTKHVNDSELASLFGKLKYEENLIDNFQYSLDDEEDTRSSHEYLNDRHEYLNDLEEEYQARALLAK
ncbi:hypothetical protein Tco_1355710 [Tanacetum coccineum]